MSGRQTINTNIRLNLANEDDRRAWAYLQSMDRKQYKSYSRAVVAALNDYFGRQERLADDPYLETREKEDAFLLRVQKTIERSLQASSTGSISGLAALLHSVQPVAASDQSDDTEDDLDTAMDFINSL